MQKTSKLKQVVKHFLATTCLTVAAASMASATPFTGPFGTTFGTAVNVGLDTPVTDTTSLVVNDWFEFEGLPGGVSLSSIFSVQDVAGFWNVSIFSDTDTPIFSQSLSVPNFAALTGNVPLDGNVVFDMSTSGEGSNSFSVTLASGTSAPEPATIACLGLGLAGLAGLGLRRRAQKS